MRVGLIKKAEHHRTDAFELWCCWRLLRVPRTARRSNQQIIKEISPEYSLEGLMLKLKLQYLGHLMWRTDSLEKTLMLGKIEGREKGDDRGWDALWHHRLNGHEFEQAPGVGDGQGGLACCSPWGHKESHTTEWLNWNELNWRTERLYSGWCQQGWRDYSQQLKSTHIPSQCGPSIFKAMIVSSLFHTLRPSTSSVTSWRKLSAFKGLCLPILRSTVSYNITQLQEWCLLLFTGSKD